MQLSKEDFRSISEEYLAPLFSGAKLLLRTQRVKPSSKIVARINPLEIAFKLHRKDTQRLILHRSQDFSKIDDPFSEITVVEAFVNALKEIEDGLQKNYKFDLLSTFRRKIVVKTISHGTQISEQTLLQAVDQLSLWETKLYEGRPIVATIGFSPKRIRGGIKTTFKDFCEKSFSSVLSNGYDTLLCFDSCGYLMSHETLSQPTRPSEFAPFRQAHVAQWATSGKIAFVLNRLGEILVFKENRLVFTRRSGKWSYLTHEPVITQMSRPQNMEIRKAIYASSLDASFARTGACIGVVTGRHAKKKYKLISKDDDLVIRHSTKAKSISKMIGAQIFQQIDRRFRQELLAIDGALILNHQGIILGVGSILKIPKGSAGGGRLAAAVELSKSGLGIKVSQDGAILGYLDKDKKFSIMSD